MPKTYVTTSRFDIEDIAAIAAFMSRNGIVIRNRSEPIAYGIKMISNIIKENHPEISFNVQEAFDFLNSLGIDCIKKNRGARALTKRLQYNELSDYGRDVECYQENKVLEPKRETKQEIILSTEDKAMIERRRKEELEEQMESFKNITGLDMEE